LLLGIRSLPNAAGRNFTTLDYANLNNLAILNYAGADVATPTADPTVSVPVSKLPLVETNLHISCFDITPGAQEGHVPG
jgi:hypothetical protein